MKIVSIEEYTIPISSAMRTASIGFGGMTASVVIVRTDAVRNGRPLVGLALDSIGRYGHGALLRERFIPRLLGCDPDDYAGARGGVDPARAWDVLMCDEKPGGHGERAGAVGLLDAALWDILAKWRIGRSGRRCTSALETGFDERGFGLCQRRSLSQRRRCRSSSRRHRLRHRSRP